MGMFMSVCALNFRRSHAAHYADVIATLIVIGGRPEVPKYIRAFIIITGNFEERQEVDPIDDCHMDVRRKGDKTGEQFFKLISCLSANAKSLGSINHRAFAIPLA